MKGWLIEGELTYLECFETFWGWDEVLLRGDGER